MAINWALSFWLCCKLQDVASPYKYIYKIHICMIIYVYITYLESPQSSGTNVADDLELSWTSKCDFLSESLCWRFVFVSNMFSVFFTMLCLFHSSMIFDQNPIWKWRSSQQFHAFSIYSPLVWNMLVLKWLCSIFRRTAHLGTFDNSMRVELNSGLQHVATPTYRRCGAATELPICETSINFVPNHQAIGIAWYSTSGTVTVSNNVQRLKDLWGFSANRSLQSQRSLFECTLRGNVFIVRLVGGKTILQVQCKWLLELNVQATICRSPISR